MAQTYSEHIVTGINSNIFFEEFTFHKNDFYPKDGKKELADNILSLDNLLFIIQIKERNKEKSKESVDKWFNNKVLKKAKNQIKNTLKYLQEYEEIPITNVKNQTIDVANVDFTKAKKLIIYKTEEELNENYRNLKFYESKTGILIHVFNIIEYFWICKFLITPTELDEYLSFRERIYLKHKKIITIYPEQYILGHFINTDDESIINEKYIESLSKIKDDTIDFNLSSFIKVFNDRIVNTEQKKSTDYHSIIKEIARLKRYELLEFKSRFLKIIEDSKLNELKLPYRFISPTTNCGFVFTSITMEYSTYWKSAILNMNESFKYKWIEVGI